MSIRVMSEVWNIDLPDSDKIVLLALADCANDEGFCWPSIATLTRKCSKTDRTIQAAIKRLENSGHIERNYIIGKGCSYIVHPRSQFTPEASSPPKPVRETPEANGGRPPKRLRANHKEPSITVNITARGARLPNDFVMPSDWLEWAMSEKGWTKKDVEQERDNFSDYWHAKTGKDAVKLDWQATWRNWTRNSRRRPTRDSAGLDYGPC